MLNLGKRIAKMAAYLANQRKSQPIEADMRRSFHLILSAALLLSACSTEQGLLRLVDPAYQTRRSAVEVEVKSSYPQILNDISTGGGSALDKAFDTAQIPVSDRPARTLQLSGDLPLYSDAPLALISTLVVWGG